MSNRVKYDDNELDEVVTDAQDEAPARIRVAQDADGFWTCREAVSGSPEYVRSDLARPSQAGDERVGALVTVARRQVESMCEGFCKNLPSAGAFTEDMDHNCAVCRMRAALAAMDTMEDWQ